jgi:hypothetical protein
MELSRIPPAHRATLALALVATLGGLLTLQEGFGWLMLVTALASLAAIAVILGPELFPGWQLPTTDGVALVSLGATAAVATVLTALNWVGWLAGHVMTFEAVAFLVALAASLGLAWAGYGLFRSETAAES